MEDTVAAMVAAVQAHGVQAHGVQAHGVQAHGVQAHGVQAHGVQAHGVQAHGVQAHGVAVAPRRRKVRGKVAAAASAGLLALSGGMAAAGALPSVAQHQVSIALAKVGIDVPKGDGGHGHPGPGPHVPSVDNADPAGGASTKTNHGACVSQVAGNGGAQVSAVAQSDCGKPPTAGSRPATDAAHGTGPPAAVKPDGKPQPTHPPQSSSGSPGATSPGNGYGTGGIPSPPGLAKSSAPPVHESPPPPSSPPGRKG
jgi:hypothetical protein